MDRAFGSDFSGVRVHTDDRADRLNRSLDARAFTTGKDVFFRQGEYQPGSPAGNKLLAHELTHVVQQTENVRAKMTIGQPGDRYEQEADRVAEQVAAMPESSGVGKAGAGNSRAMCPECEEV
jgi:ribonuclease HI